MLSSTLQVGRLPFGESRLGRDTGDSTAGVTPVAPLLCDYGTLLPSRWCNAARPLRHDCSVFHRWPKVVPPGSAGCLVGVALFTSSGVQRLCCLRSVPRRLPRTRVFGFLVGFTLHILGFVFSYWPFKLLSGTTVSALTGGLTLLFFFDQVRPRRVRIAGWHIAAKVEELMQ
ncbi:hypothetical protein KSP40_PGU022370 [Platanthera guangdongensis]|uniref:Uncharacterized protein n=1 Tax=Platanthera guangdongensis TaxID=2320717 RepID=A0ABR2M7J3_9ASPA